MRDVVAADPATEDVAGAAGDALPVRRRVVVGALCVVTVALVALGLRLVAGHAPFAWWKGVNGDHYYYLAMSLQNAGWSYPDSLQTTASYFHYIRPTNALNYGFLNPQTAPLIYPRVVLPLAAWPFVAAYGVSGIWLPGAVFGTVTLGVLVVVALRRFDPMVALALVGLAVFSRTVLEFSFGIYTEAPMLAVLAIVLGLLPFDNAPRSWRAPVTVGLLVFLLTFIRQVLVVPIAMLGCGWLYAWVRTRSWRNAWLPFTAATAVAVAAGTLLLQRWAPYDPLVFLEGRFGVHSVAGLLPHLPRMLANAMRADVARAWTRDRLTDVLPFLALVGVLRTWRTALPWVVLGAGLAGVLITMLNGLPTEFRYLSPILPGLLLLAAVGLVELCRGAGRLLRVPGVRTTVLRPSAPATRVGSWAGLGAAAAAVVVVVTALLVQSQPADLRRAARLDVSAATYGPGWPIKDTSGTLLCAGGNAQVWFRSSSGRLYAFSGTAMARSLSTPRLMSRSLLPVAKAWPASRRLLDEGISLCQPALAGPWGVPAVKGATR